MPLSAPMSFSVGIVALHDAQDLAVIQVIGLDVVESVVSWTRQMADDTVPAARKRVVAQVASPHEEGTFPARLSAAVRAIDLGLTMTAA